MNIRETFIKISIALAFGGLCWLIQRVDPSGHYLNIPGLLWVIAGTLAMTVLAQSSRSVIDLFRQLPQKLKKSNTISAKDIAIFMRIVDLHRQGSARSAEMVAKRLHEPLLRNGVELVINRTPEADLIRIMQWRIGALREQDYDDVKIVRTLGIFAPAFGMLGTLIGLIEMMYALDTNNLDKIGQSMGFALLTTAYGLVLANFIFKPLASRLEQRAKDRAAWLQVQAEAVRMLHDRCHPTLMQDYWQAFFDRSESETKKTELPSLSVIKSTS
jgi:chemotaxis protein MotA